MSDTDYTDQIRFKQDVEKQDDNALRSEALRSDPKVLNEIMQSHIQSRSSTLPDLSFDEKVGKGSSPIPYPENEYRRHDQRPPYKP
jgi:hypothetical protein